jgi:hypothetical protein
VSKYVEVSSDAKRLLVSGRDAKGDDVTRVYSCEGASPEKLAEHAFSARFGANGQTLVVQKNGRIEIRDAVSGEARASFFGPERVGAVAVLADGSVFTGGGSGGTPDDALVYRALSL